ncbi:hypothetical protein CE91St36_05020 [Christensenellaceae bacterium]|nr:hypothetical protein CE91St36_05020 [Christensenellaceae bacterium]BDF60353.1 hypothetical protein CE91St37_05030 [Christensenellaceae bacterium]
MDTLEAMPLMLVAGPDVTVTSWEDFKDSVEQAEVDGKVIRLDPSLAGTLPAALTLNIAHNNSIMIDGGGLSLTSPSGAKAFTFNNTGTGSITLTNMTLDGTGGSGGMLSFTGSAFTLDNVTLQNISGTAIATSGANAIVRNMTVDTATNGIAGSGTLDIADSTFKGIAATAVTAGSGNVTVTDTTFDGVTNGAAIRGGAGTLDVTGSTLTNITGNGIADSSGTVTLDDCTLSNINGVGLSGGSNALVKNTLFENVRNNLGGHGSAILSPTNLTVEDSSFVNSASTLDSGYIQGAIVSYGGSGRAINITRSYFKDNKASRYGGALGFYQFGGTVNISYSYFDGNSVSGKSASSDGGAIGVYNNSSSVMYTINVDNNTFVGNTAQDDGSALFFEGRNDMVVANVTHNTFYGNKASKYLLSVADSGGVVQLSLDVVGNFTNNTFIGNTAPNYATKHGAGAAVGAHIDSANTAVRPTATFKNNIFVGNGGNGGNNYASRNIDITDGSDLGGNVGYDNGTVVDAAVTADAVFGTSPQPRTNSTNYGAAGKAGSGYTSALTTVTVLPNDGVTGFADNTAGSPVYSKDARGFTRDDSASDAGAMEIKFVKFDANGGEWNGLSSLTYDGSKYYADDTASTGYFLVTDPGGSVSVLTSDLPTNGTKTFAGWYDAPTGGNEVTGNVTATDQTLYARWADDTPAVQFTITYYGNGSDIGSVPAQETYDGGDSATIAGPGTMGKTNATFTGWNTSSDGTGASYTPSQTFSIGADLELYAQWQDDDPSPIALYTLDFDSQGGSSVDSIHNIPSGSTVSEPAPPAREGHTFQGWHKEAETINPWNFDHDVVVGHTTLYAKWQPVVQNLFTVTFDSQGETSVDPVTDIVPGSRIAAPTPPTREGYIFRGWYQESECVNYWFFDYYDVNESRTLYAKWEPVTGEAGSAADTTATGSAPKTGDTDTDILVWLVIAVSVAALAVVSVKLLRKQDN